MLWDILGICLCLGVIVAVLFGAMVDTELARDKEEL